MKYIGAGSAAGLAGCSTNSSPDDGSSGSDGGDGVAERTRGDLFTAASTSTATGLNFLEIGDTTTGNRLGRLFDAGGRAIGPETFGGYWFESWELSDDFKKVEIKLRDGLEWGTGSQLDAEDYLYSLENIILSDWYEHTDAGQYELGVDSEQVSYNKTGTLTFTEELPVSKPLWLHENPLQFQYPAPKDMVSDFVDEQNKDGLNNRIVTAMKEGELGTGNLGPYVFDEWDRDSRWVYTRNDEYYMQDVGDDPYDVDSDYYDYAESPYFDEYRTQLFDESSTALSALKTGEIDSFSIGATNVDSIKGSRNINVWQSKFDNGTFWLNINHRANGWAPLRESREVRQAMGNLYDRETIIEQVNQGNALPMSTYHPRWGPYYPDESELYIPEGTVEEAKSLLESGTSSDYGYDEDGTFRGPEGSQVQLKAPRPPGSESTEIASNYMADRLAEAGIELQIEALNWNSVLRNFAANSARNADGVDEPDWSAGFYNGGPWNQSVSANEWDLMFGLGFSTSPYAPWGTIRVTMTEKGGFNLWGYHQDEIDIKQKVADASTASDKEVTNTEMNELFGFLSRDMPLVWTNSSMIFQGYRDRIAGLPGESTSYGTKARSFFESPDNSRLVGLRQQ